MFWHDFIAYPKIKTLREYSRSEGTDTFIGIFWYWKEVCILYFIMVVEELNTLI